MAEDKHNPELNGEAAEDAGLSQAYQAVSAEQPAAHLDDAILAAARKSVKSGPRRVTGLFPTKWVYPVSLAAVLVLSVSIILSMQFQDVTQDARVQDSFELSSIRINDTASKETAITLSASAPASPDIPPPRMESAGEPMLLEEITVISRDLESDLSQIPAPVTRIAAEDEIDNIRPDIALRETANGEPPAFSRGRALQSAQETRDAVGGPSFIFDGEETVLIASNQAPSGGTLEEIVVTGSRVRRQEDTEGQRLAAFAAINRNQESDDVLQVLAGPWSGQATTNTNHQVPYDINFIFDSADCVTGTADTGVSTHTWRFCEENNLLMLEISRNLNGMTTTLGFEQSSRDEGGITFKADTIDYLEIGLTYDEVLATLVIMQNGELHTVIQLTKD